MLRAYLLAHPAGHSLSPFMHDAAFAAVGIDARYRALDVAPADLASVVEGFRSAPGFVGANVTVPHKRAVMEFLDQVDGTATAIGAVNTIERLGGPGGRLVGRNTDADGFLGALDELTPAHVGRVLLLGAGGSARAVAWAMLSRGATVSVLNRSRERAEELVEDVGLAAGVALGRLRVCEPDAAQAALAACDLLVNSTSVGMVGGPAPATSPAPGPLSTMRQGAVVMDLVYRPAVTPLLRLAGEAGIAHVNGLPMLVYQGAAAFGLWTGRPAPVEAMRSAVVAALR
ncbi:MAG TPA: shikimate dehydrogenase [Trueperaceae bacterium]|nr:shikimate dehydrogenase [Trueperaceae bacterium]